MDLKSFSYTLELEEVIKHSKWSDVVTDYSKKSTPEIIDRRKNPLQGHVFNLRHKFTSLLQFENTLYYFFVNDTSDLNAKKPKEEFNLTIFMFTKADGSNQNKKLNEFKGTPTCIATGFSMHQRKESQQCNKLKRRLNIIVLVGLKEGQLKVIQFQRQKSKVLKTSIYSHKIQQKPINSVIIPQKIHYNQKNICFLLIQDNKVFIFNYISRVVIAIYQPPIISHDFSICMTLHQLANYLGTCTKSGQITIWEINKQTLSAIQRSQQRSMKSVKSHKNGNKEEDIYEQVWSFKIKDRVISVFPIYMLHSASIDGLKWFSFMGNLLALVSRKGLFRIIAVNFEMKDEFIILLEHQIERGESISSVQLFAERETLVVTKAQQYLHVIDNFEQKRSNLKDSEKLKWKQSFLNANNYNSKMNYNCVEPFRELQSTVEKYIFSSQLKIVKVIKLFVKSGNKIVNFNSSILNNDHTILLAETNNEFYIMPCPNVQ